MGIWWMYDNHTFERLPTNKEELRREAINCWEIDPWGAIGVKGEHGDGLVVIGTGRDNRCEFINQLDEWLDKLGRQEEVVEDENLVG